MRQDGVEQDHRPELQILAIVMIIVACVSIVARFCSRALSPPPAAGNPRWWWDDWTALAATPFVLAQLIMELVMIHLGFGADISGLSREAQLPIFKLLFAFYMIYDIGVSFAKASTLFFLRRAFPTYVSPAWFNIGLWVIHFLNIGWLIGMIFATTFVCDPVAKVWNPFLSGDCVPQASLWIGNAMSSVAIDLLILLLPLPRVWALRVTRLTRLGITIVLGFGYGVILVFIGRSIAAFRSPDDLGRQLSGK
ncbi:hypothetical protein S7711_02312 [Stachybotrys chartarum IBT 7711]|uniref:Rhodopsin domain-containing protein n=1 Tax=Stachybotrys chartarum (strain CBS 109288 / IBT 7711) TaxID=1280523 RepID=A0A084B0X2_STACB|nr:hypothetical protein S7711_02312 [Stachybotrys chartarum IBT 7711]KFA56394.1 hypothetical protein S40293_05010 [Stachybotrys chartarum IBT 40293]KFA71150.1 hypothetical protein S40288_04691 [Stachybotrys chartarum IBT 40288]